MMPYFREHIGNPSSVHRFGRRMRAAVDTAREQVAELVGAHPTQVIFTSGGTEANNLAITGVIAEQARRRIVIGATEHPSVVKAAESRQGWIVDRAEVDAQGRILGESLDRALANGPVLVSIMYANNETGVVQDVAAISALVRASGAVMHVDAVQAVGKIDVDFANTGAHLMSMSAHKIYGPKGVGALIVDKAIDLRPLIHGGGQEKDRRGGTENVAAIVGFGTAAALARERLAVYREQMTRLRLYLEAKLRAIGDIAILSEAAPRLPNTVCFAAHGTEGETLVLNLDKSGFAVSSGSACSSGRTDPSPVLLAMGVPVQLARGAIRVSFGWDNTEAEIDKFIETFKAQLPAPGARIVASAVANR